MFIFLGRNVLPLSSKIFLCLLLGTVSGDVVARVGEDVSLRCFYNANYYGRLYACWGRGPVPRSGCNDQVIASDGTSVTSRRSGRYQLLGALGNGEVSLTIRQVQEDDSGIYGCRVEIPGWFNDHKHHVTLKVVPAPPSPLKIEVREVTERAVSIRWSPVFDGGRPILSYNFEIKNWTRSWNAGRSTKITHTQLTSVTMADVRPASTYNLRMFATNRVGMSLSSNVLTITTKEAAPEGPPLDTRLEAVASTSVKVMWKPPQADLKNGVLRHYIIKYREENSGKRQDKWMQRTVNATQELESVILTNLKPSTMYEVKVLAQTNAGMGPASAPLQCSTLDEILQTSTASTSSTTASTSRSPASTSTSPASTSRSPASTSRSPASTSRSPASTSRSPASTSRSPASTSRSTASTSTSAPTAATEWTPAMTDLASVHTTSLVEPVTTSPVQGDNTTSFPSGLPEPPVVALKEVTDMTFTLTWTPGFEGDSPITGYYLEYKELNAYWEYATTTVDFSPNETEATVIEINPSTYNVRMFALSDLGTSGASNVLTITTTQTNLTGETGDPTASHDSDAAESSKKSGGVHPVAIVVPVVLVVLIVGVAAAWILHQVHQREGYSWLASRAFFSKDSDTLHEL